MPRKKSTKRQTPPPDALTAWSEALRNGDDWFDALLNAIGRWELAEETVGGRHYSYLISGEAFDWLLLAERLCEEADGAIPAEEREALLFFGRTPRPLDETEFKRAIGDAKHHAHLNFVYGVAVEEALQLVVEEEVLKEDRACGSSNNERSVEDRVFDRLYGRPLSELMAGFMEQRGMPAGDELSYAEFQAFTYWLFKFRVDQSDPARVASDTRRALVQISELEVASRRRRQYVASGAAKSGVVVDGEVVARVR